MLENNKLKFFSDNVCYLKLISKPLIIKIIVFMKTILVKLSI